MKRDLLIKGATLSLLLAMATTNAAIAKNADYYEGKGRIVLSSDGNMHDDDDMLATKMTLMILAKAGLQKKTVLYTYADHIWGSEANDLEIMRRSAEVTGAKFGFKRCNFMPAVKDPEAAYAAMAEQIAKSTEKDPLFILMAGPMQVIGEALKIANEKNPEALNYVTIISHSIWNENHSQNSRTHSPVGPRGPEAPHDGWIWSECEALYGDRVNFNHISDQNGTGVGNEVYRTKDKFAAKTWETWAWMDKHQDPNVRWVYSNEGIDCRPDYSDAGIAYYFCADLDGVRGDEMGNPAKLERWIGEECIPTK